MIIAADINFFAFALLHNALVLEIFIIPGFLTEKNGSDVPVDRKTLMHYNIIAAVHLLLVYFY